VQVTATVPFSALTALSAALVQYGMTGMRPGAANIFSHCSIGMITFLIAVQVRRQPRAQCTAQNALSGNTAQVADYSIVLPDFKLHGLLWHICNLLLCSSGIKARSGQVKDFWLSCSVSTMQGLPASRNPLRRCTACRCCTFQPL
jgi:hypothetical protein